MIRHAITLIVVYFAAGFFITLLFPVFGLSLPLWVKIGLGILAAGLYVRGFVQTKKLGYRLAYAITFFIWFMPSQILAFQDVSSSDDIIWIAALFVGVLPIPILHAINPKPKDMQS